MEQRELTEHDITGEFCLLTSKLFVYKQGRIHYMYRSLNNNPSRIIPPFAKI